MKFARDRGFNADIKTLMDSVGITELNQQTYLQAIRQIESARR